MVTAFILAHRYGTSEIVSSCYFKTEGNIISPSINANRTSGNGWVCEHRWTQLVAFRNASGNSTVINWWGNSGNASEETLSASS